MKKLFLSGIAALFLATGAVHAEERPQWSSDFRHCMATKNFTDDTANVVVFEKSVSLDLEELLELQRHIPLLKKCSAFWQCVDDGIRAK
jgi:hypothetical protein